MRSTPYLFMTFLTLGAAGCSGGSGKADAAPPDAEVPDADKGPGSQTLLIQGTCIADNSNNISDGTNMTVDCIVVVTKDGEPVTDAIVQLRPQGFEATLVAPALMPNVYQGNYTMYDATVRVEIWRQFNRDEDYLSETTLLTAPIHQIEMPFGGSIHPVTSDLHVTWGLPGGAEDWADIGLASGYEVTDIIDSGSFDIPSVELSVGKDEVIVRRWHHNSLVGGAATGSYLDIAVESRQNITLE